jgi:hypothetical protein
MHVCVCACMQIAVSPGETIFIPSGWIHAVYTPEDSIVVAGNFINSASLKMSLNIWDIEERTSTSPRMHKLFSVRNTARARFVDVHGCLCMHLSDCCVGIAQGSHTYRLPGFEAAMWFAAAFWSEQQQQESIRFRTCVECVHAHARARARSRLLLQACAYCRCMYDSQSEIEGVVELSRRIQDWLVSDLHASSRSLGSRIASRLSEVAASACRGSSVGLDPESSPNLNMTDS